MVREGWQEFLGEYPGRLGQGGGGRRGIGWLEFLSGLPRGMGWGGGVAWWIPG